MENQLSEILDNLLGMLLLEGSYEIEGSNDGFSVSIETKDAGRLIGARGESLDALQLLVNQMVSKKVPADSFKRVVIDVMGWKKQKEEELTKSAQNFGKQVLESGQPLELEPQSAWQRRVVHMVIGEMEGLSSESVGEGRDRHVVIKLKAPAEGPLRSEASEARQGRQNPKVKTEEQDVKTAED